MKRIVARAKKALDMNKNGRIDWWEVGLLFSITFIVAAFVEFVF